MSALAPALLASWTAVGVYPLRDGGHGENIESPVEYVRQKKLFVVLKS